MLEEKIGNKKQLIFILSCIIPQALVRNRQKHNIADLKMFNSNKIQMLDKI